MRAIIYARVSTSGQSRDDQISLHTQVESCRDYAESHSYEVIDTLQEVGSAGSVHGRPLLLDAMRRIKMREAQVLLAYNVDRLTREQAGMFVIDEELRRGGGASNSLQRSSSKPLLVASLEVRAPSQLKSS